MVMGPPWSPQSCNTSYAGVCRSRPALCQESTEALPEQFELVEKEYAWQEGDQGITIVMGKRVLQMPRQQSTTITHHLPLTTATSSARHSKTCTPCCAWSTRGVSPSVKRPATLPPAAVAEIGLLLRDGDFYALTPKKTQGSRPWARSRRTPGHCSCKAAKLAERHGKIRADESRPPGAWHPGGRHPGSSGSAG